MAVKKRSLTIVHLYPRLMDIYGDTGNVLVIRRRCEWRDIKTDIVQVEPGQKIPAKADIIISGGGQDKGQITVQDDLLGKRNDLTGMAEDGVTMLVICGTYQLFGRRFVTSRGKTVSGIGIFEMDTIAGEDRQIGNIEISASVGTLIGYENHSGQTLLDEGQQPFGTIVNGFGNNAKDKTEGAQLNNVFGTYLHGPILPKNPHFADDLIKRALIRKYGNAMLNDLDDSLADQASAVARSRPR